jgi:hypothetical protein
MGYLLVKCSEVGACPRQRHDTILEPNLPLEDVALNLHDALCDTRRTRLIRSSLSLSHAAYIATETYECFWSSFLNIVTIALSYYRLLSQAGGTLPAFVVFMSACPF